VNHFHKPLAREIKSIGATLNQDGRLVIRAEQVGSQTQLARITRSVIQAQGEKAPLARMADRISAIFVPIIIALICNYLFKLVFLRRFTFGSNFASHHFVGNCLSMCFGTSNTNCISGGFRARSTAWNILSLLQQSLKIRVKLI